MSIRSEIDGANQRFMQAFADADAAGIASCYTPDGQALPPGGETQSGRAAIQAMWESVIGMGIKRAELETVEVEALGDSTALEQGRYRLFGDGGTALDHGKYIVVWRRDGGDWKLHRDIWNSSKNA